MSIDLTIDTLTVGGRGLGRYQGKAVFVPLTAPGDRVRCRIIRSRRHYDEAVMEELLEPAAGRREPACPVFGECGGCQWQHLPYHTQIYWKERIFRETLLRSRVADETGILPMVPAPDEWNYRNRAQFKCRKTADGVVTGFYRPGSHFIVDTPHCKLVNQGVQQAYTYVRNDLPSAPHASSIPQFDVACGDNQLTSLLLHALPEGAVENQSWLGSLAIKRNLGAALQVGRKESIAVVAGDPSCTVHIDEPRLALRVSPGGFVQVNSAQNRSLVSAVVSAASLTGKERIVDLFCGAGNFSLPLARRAAEVHGVENYAPAIADARMNGKSSQLDNVTFYSEDASLALPRLAAAARLDMILLDPPRTGAYPVVSALLSAAPRRIIYVSCDPVTLVRDLQPLVHGGYRVVSSQPFDLFPQTWHIESLTVLEQTA